MKWILYLMLFSTPAANVTEKVDKMCLKHDKVTEIKQILQCRPKFESRRVWSLQTTSQMEFAQFDSCLRTQDELMASSNVASTMTLRTWCFCEDPNNKCPSDADLSETVTTLRNCESRGESSCRAEASNKIQSLTQQPQKGQNASSIRLYPPQK
ncbi:MAG: hypothetical protein QOD11_439 [Bradyrhizobium sp.]|jgi:hypothetical protein|nr:hypothetical protein [Bradyrhizobium sp.]